jgi:TolA-binding protein
MKKLVIITLLFATALTSTAQFSEKPIPPTETSQKVVEVDSVLYVQIVTTSYQRLSDKILNQYDQLESSMDNLDAQKNELKERQKEYAQLLRQAIRSGYEPRNKVERGTFLRIKEKIDKEKK